MNEGGDEELNLGHLCNMTDSLPVDYTQYKEKLHISGFQLSNWRMHFP